MTNTAATDEDFGFVFRETDQDGRPGRTFAFRDATVSPLSYEALQSARLHLALTIPLEWRNAAVTSTEFDEIDPDARARVSATLETTFTSQAIGLVPGGWLPSGFAATVRNTSILIDRNVLTQIEGRFATDGTRKGEGQDFLDLFADAPIRINPLLYVMEGAERRRPTRPELEEQLEKVVRKLEAALPKATLMIGPKSLDSAEGLLDDRRASTDRNRAFLLDIARDLESPIGASRFHATWERVVASADRHGVRRSSLVLLAVLSAMAVPNGRSPARAILKFKRGYEEGDAYNALTDLSALELYCALLAAFPNETMQLCTGDKPLALFWVGIQASDFVLTAAGYQHTLAPNQALLPGDSHALWKSLLEG